MLSPHKFILSNCDTDSVMFCKPDMSPFSEDDIYGLLEEINELMPENIKFEDDGKFRKVIILKTKNYILDDGVKVKLKGSGLKDNKREPAIKEYLNAIVTCLLGEFTNEQLLSIYHKYVKEIVDIKDIKRWGAKYTISDKTLNSDRTNEEKIRDAIVGTEYVEGDKLYMFFKPDTSLCLVERYDGTYSKEHLLKKLYNASDIFSNVIDPELFPNYFLQGNKGKLHELMGWPTPDKKPRKKNKNVEILLTNNVSKEES